MEEASMIIHATEFRLNSTNSAFLLGVQLVPFYIW